MLLLRGSVLLWMIHITSVRSQFPFLSFVQPVQRHIANFAAIAPLPQVRAPVQQPETPEDKIANSRLKKCCARLRKENKADSYCLSHYCDFSAITKEKVLQYMTVCRPRGDTVPYMWKCVSSYQNHEDCCRAAGVSKRCMAYCRAQNEVPEDPLIYMGCLRDFDAIKVCFRRYLAHHSNVYGET